METNGKIRGLDELARLLASLRDRKKIVHCHGVFDLLHIGHIRHFEQAKRNGEVLVVTLTPDRYVNKGPHRPFFPEPLRAEAIAALGCVDFVAINKWPNAVETIKLLRPAFYVKGSDYKDAQQDRTGGIELEEEAVRSVGGRIVFTDDITFSSSALLNRQFSTFAPEVDRYLEEFRSRRSVDEVLGWLDRAASLHPVVVGEAIVDEYVFCEGIGKSTKDPTLAVRQQSVESCAGGTLAIANHLAGLCREATLVTQLGSAERREDFAGQTLRPNVRPLFLTKTGAPTVHKRRIVDRYSGNKLLEIYMMEDSLTAGEDARALLTALNRTCPKSDLTLVADYGHGMMTGEAIDLLCRTAPFLTVNAQSNAGNLGFNPISKYRRADYICLASHEIALEARQRQGSLPDALLMVAKQVDCSRFMVTVGKQGNLYYDASSGFMDAPALATVVRDRVGAGDAVLAVTALLVRLGAPPDITLFVGNVAGAELVAELGNRRPLERAALGKHITSLLK